jgi:hypothetical protein
MAKRRKALLASTAAATVVLAGTWAGAAYAADPPALAFTVASTNINVPRYLYEDGYVSFDLDLGVNLIPGKDPFEIRATRASYADPIVAKQYVVKNGKRTAVTLPAGLVTDFNGLKNFSTTAPRSPPTSATSARTRTTRRAPAATRRPTRPTRPTAGARTRSTSAPSGASRPGGTGP